MKLTLFQRHCERWHDCSACNLYKTRSQVVLARGTVPCDVVLIGEAPGISEDSIGLPFIGPAGHLLDQIINKAMDYDKDGNPLWIYAMTNLCCCLPIGEDGLKAAEPDDDYIEACSPRLQEFMEIANPSLIVTVGRLATEWLDPQYKKSISFHKPIPMVSVLHPAAILRMQVAQQWLARQKCIVTIRQAVEEMLERNR